MCGIAGIISQHKHLAIAPCIRSMTNSLAHRGPNAEGFFIEGPVGLGHRRLSVIDLSAAANQPFEDVSGRYVIIYNGEVYNFQALRQELAPHYPFQTQVDSEVVLAAYIHWGAESLNRFNGMFAFAIWDKLEQQLFVARDRLGIKPLYYFLTDESLIFASEIRALLASEQLPRKLEKTALVDYLTYQTVHAPNCLIQGVKMLEAGSYATYQDGVFTQSSYWELTNCRQPHPYQDLPSNQRNVRNLLQEAVSRRLVSDVPLGAFLSGGIDSSAIVALMAAASEQAVNTFSVVFEEKAFDESPWSSLIAQTYNTRHHPILLKPSDFLEALPEALNAMDSPSGDGINSYVVSKMTQAAGITVALSGLGGDELFAGYPVFQQWMQLQNKKWFWKVPHLLREGTGQLAKSVLNNHKTDRLHELMTLDEMNFAQAYPVFRKLISPEAIAQLNGNLPTTYNAITHMLAAKSQHIAMAPLLSQVSMGEISSYTQNVLLRDTDQMSMAHALEVRVPFFDHELVEYVLGVPDTYKFPHSPKQLLVDSLGDLIPADIVNRPKMGFVFPWNQWLRSELKTFADKRLNQLATRPIFEGKQILDLWSRFLQHDKKINWVNIWTLVVLEVWLDNNGW